MLGDSFQEITEVKLVTSIAGWKIAVSVFVIDGLLIDTGSVKKEKEIISLFNKHKINEVILTHHHEDHTGAANWIERNKKIPIYIHEMGVKNCLHRMKLPLYRKILWGERKSFRPITLKDTHKTPTYTWDVIHTPGHAHDHVALYNREKKWMFGGDLYVQAHPKSLFVFESFPTIIQSLRTILTYDFETYFCSHAGIIVNGKEAIEEKLNYLESIERQVLDLHLKGNSRFEIRKQLLPNRHPMNYFSFCENSPQHLVNSILK